MRATLAAASSRTVALGVVLACEAALAVALHVDAGRAVTITICAVGVVLSLASPYALMALAFPATLATWRLDAGTFDLSYADAALAVLVPVALLRIPRADPLLRRIALAALAYGALLAVGVLATPSAAAVVEIAHRLVMVLGAVCVGAALRASGQDRRALRWFVVATSALAIVAVHATLTDELTPAYPLGIHKNAAGILLASAIIALVVLPAGTVVPGRWGGVLTAVNLGGMVACQSRGAALTLAAVLTLSALARRGRRGWLLLIVPLALGTLLSIASRDLGDTSADARFNSVNTRLDAYEHAYGVFRDNPLTGGGLRYWRSGPYAGPYEPHNVVLSTLAESGLTGLLGMVALLSCTLLLARRAPGPYGHLAVALGLAHLFDSMTGIYWVAGPGTLPWLALGLVVAAPAMAPDRGAVTERRALVGAGT